MKEIKHEKKYYIYYFLIVLCLFTTSCRTTKTINAGNTISRNSYTVGRLEETIEALDGTVSDSRKRLENIIETSREITDGIDRLEYLFYEYESEVNRLLDEIDTIRIEAENKSKNNNDCSDNFISVYSR